MLFLVGIIIFIFTFFFVYTTWSAAPFIPTHASEVDALIGLTNFSEDDVVYELGSGDCRLLIAAVIAGAGRGVGLELNPFLVWWGRWRVWRAGMSDKISVRFADAWRAELCDATVVITFWFGSRMEKLRDKLRRELRPGTRVLSYAFRFPEMKPVAQNRAAFLYVFGFGDSSKGDSSKSPNFRGQF
ncbi:MAG: hypothetical protein HW383_191 [Candidatus Magasanikbacteria bacterium]|nr:hypothetical protein [Candidatus Magasanikbacteria bacterium]